MGCSEAEMIFLGCLKISWTDPPVCVSAECPPGLKMLAILVLVSYKPVSYIRKTCSTHNVHCQEALRSKINLHQSMVNLTKKLERAEKLVSDVYGFLSTVRLEQFSQIWSMVLRRLYGLLELIVMSLLCMTWSCVLLWSVLMLWFWRRLGTSCCYLVNVGWWRAEQFVEPAGRNNFNVCRPGKEILTAKCSPEVYYDFLHLRANFCDSHLLFVKGDYQDLCA